MYKHCLSLSTVIHVLCGEWVRHIQHFPSRLHLFIFISNIHPFLNTYTIFFIYTRIHFTFTELRNITYFFSIFYFFWFGRFVWFWVFHFRVRQTTSSVFSKIKTFRSFVWLPLFLKYALLFFEMNVQCTCVSVIYGRSKQTERWPLYEFCYAYTKWIEFL